MRFSTFFLIIALGFYQVAIYAETALGTSIEKKAPKLLVLIIANDDLPVYVEEQRLWRSYMHLDPRHIKAFFIKGDPNLARNAKVEGDIIWCKTVENFIPGILAKTILSMELMLSKKFKFDFVLRTNLSSFYVFPRLMNFLKKSPDERFYGAVPLLFFGVNFGSGAGIIFSRDVVEMLVQDKQTLLNYPQEYPYYDDFAIGDYLQKQHIPITATYRMDFWNLEEWLSRRNTIPSLVFHFRCKNNDPNLRSTDEIFIMNELIKKFY